MRSGKVCLTVIAASVIGCAGPETARIDDARLVHLPAQAKNVVLDRERNVNAAESNLEAMRTASHEAQGFRAIVEQELSAAETRLDAVERSVDLAHTSRDRDMRQQASASERVAVRRLAAADSKLEYARALEELRSAQVTVAEAQLAVARAKLERAKYRQLEANNMADGLTRASFEHAVVAAEGRLNKEQEEEARVRREVDRRQDRWQARRKEYQALAGPTEQPAIDAPAPPEPVQIQPPPQRHSMTETHP